METNAEKQRAKLQRMVDALAKQQARMLLAEKAAQRRNARQAAKQRAAERAADAHRKISLGGLVIAAGVEGWDPAEIVGALLLVSERLEQEPGGRRRIRERGISHLQAREAARGRQ